MIEENHNVNIATGLVLPLEKVKILQEILDIGTNNMETFIEYRINTNKVSFWEPIKKVKIKKFASTKNIIVLKSANEKVISIDADRDLFGRLLVIAKSREN